MIKMYPEGHLYSWRYFHSRILFLYLELDMEPRNLCTSIILDFSTGAKAPLSHKLTVFVLQHLDYAQRCIHGNLIANSSKNPIIVFSFPMCHLCWWHVIYGSVPGEIYLLHSASKNVQTARGESWTEQYRRYTNY